MDRVNRDSSGEPEDVESSTEMSQAETPLFDELTAQLRETREWLRSGGPPVNWERLELHVAGLLDEPEKSEVTQNVLTWKAWDKARSAILKAASEQVDRQDKADSED